MQDSQGDLGYAPPVDLAVDATPVGKGLLEAIQQVGHVPLPVASLPLPYDRGRGHRPPARAPREQMKRAVDEANR